MVKQTDSKLQEKISKKLAAERPGTNEEMFEAIDEAIEEDIEEKKQKQEEHRKNLHRFILNPQDLPQELDHAVGSIIIDGTKYRYYGTVIEEIVQKTIKKTGKIMEIIQKEQVLVLENGHLISINCAPEGVKFEFQSIMNFKKSRWSRDSVAAFCYNMVAKEDVSFDKVFNVFKEFYKKNAVLEDDEWYDLNALWDMATYYYDLISKFLILKHEGASGGGKSKVGKISTNLAFNGVKFLCPKPANFFRYRHNNKATIFIEEAERLFDDSKKKSEGDSDLIEYLNGSYEKGNTVPRQNKDDFNITDEFDPAGFTRIGAIKPLQGALKNRTIALHMIKAPKNDPRSRTEIPPANEAKYQAARDMAYCCGLMHYKEYIKALDNLENIYSFSNREWQLARPLLALAQCVNKSLELSMGSFLERLFEIRDSDKDGASWEMVLADALIQMTCTDDDVIPKFYPSEQIKNAFLRSMQERGLELNKFSAHALTKLMYSIGFANCSSRSPDRTQRGYQLRFYKVLEILIRNDLTSLAKTAKKVSEVSDNKFSLDKLEKWHQMFSDSFQTKIKVSEKVSERSIVSASKDQKVSGDLSEEVSGLIPLNSSTTANIDEKSDTSDTFLGNIQGMGGSMTKMANSPEYEQEKAHTPKSCILGTRPTLKKSEIIEFIQQNDKGKGVDLPAIMDRFGEDAKVIGALAKLCRTGDLSSPRPNIWKVEP